MPSCAFTRCKNSSRTKNKFHGITFHSFPQDESWRYKWVRVVRKQRQEPAWSPTSHSRVCSLHFRPEDMYTTGKGRKKINSGASPSFKAPIAAKPTRSDSHSSDSDSSETDSDSSKEVPANTFLKRKIEKVIADKKRVLQVNVNLKKQNKRLILKCKSFKEIVVALNEKIRVLESKLEDQNNEKPL